MAIFDWSLQTITRSAERAPSRSAVAAAAYRSGTCLRDHRTGAEHDFTQRRGIYSTIVLPPGIAAPSLVRPGSRSELRSRLWNAAEAAETRRNSVVAREITLALPHELSPDDGRRLARVYAGHIAKTFGVAVDFAVHPPSRNGDQRNVHAHVLFTTRRVSDGLSFGKKTRELDAAATGGPIIKALREKWAALTNLMLLDVGLDVSIDHRSLAALGIAREPGHHIGPQATNLARALRFKAARLIEEAEEIEREVLPQLWSVVHVEAGEAEPERVEEGWAEWAALHERVRRTDVEEIDENADIDRHLDIVTYEPPPFDWAAYDVDRFRVWARGESVAQTVFSWSEYRPDEFRGWARRKWPEKQADVVAEPSARIVDEGDLVPLRLEPRREGSPALRIADFLFLERYLAPKAAPEEKPVEPKPEAPKPSTRPAEIGRKGRSKEKDGWER